MPVLLPRCLELESPFALKGIVVACVAECDVEQLVKFVGLITPRSAVRVCPSQFFIFSFSFSPDASVQNLHRRNSEQNFAAFDRLAQKKSMWQKGVFEKVAFMMLSTSADAPIFSGRTEP